MRLKQQVRLLAQQSGANFQHALGSREGEARRYRIVLAVAPVIAGDQVSTDAVCLLGSLPQGLGEQAVGKHQPAGDTNTAGAGCLEQAVHGLAEVGAED